MRLDLPTPSLSLVRQMPTDPFNVTELRIVVHAGTHLDSTRHYHLDGPGDGRGAPGAAMQAPRGLVHSR